MMPRHGEPNGVKRRWVINAECSTFIFLGCIDVQQVDISVLQDKLRARGQVVDFIPGQPEKCPNPGPLPQF
jgi:hypothetical protein